MFTGWLLSAGRLAEAVRIVFNLRQRPDAKRMVKLAEPWRPWRGVAAHLFWAYYRVAKQRDGAPISAQTILVKKAPVKKKMAKANGR